MKRIFTTLSLLVLFMTIIYAQAPQKFNYQATLRDNAGQLLVSQNVSLRISILQGSSSGSSIYSETHAVTSTSQGIVNLQVGNGTSVNDFNAINWSNGPYFVKIELDPDGGSNYATLGTSELISVPYALSAKSAEEISWENIQNKPVLSDVATSGSYNDLSDKPFVPENTSDLNNDAGFAALPEFASNYGLYLYNNGSTLSWKPAINDAYNPLFVDKNYLGIAKSGATNNGYLSSTDWNLFNSKVSSPWMISGSNIYYNDGNVGIGTASPITKLNIVGTVEEGDGRAFIRIKNNATGPKAQTAISLNSFEDKSATFGFESSTYGMYDLADFGFLTTNGRGFAFLAPNAGQIRFYTNLNGDNSPTEQMRITENGYIGIGTDNPVTKLNIVGNVEEGDGRAFIRIKNNATGPKAQTAISLNSFEDKSATFGFESSTYGMYDLANFGFLTTNGRGFAFLAPNDGQIRFYTNLDGDNSPTEQMRIDANGNVGIGTTSPTAKLEIAEGDVYIKDISKGIIMTSPDGQCWRGTLNNSGVLTFSAISCP